MIWIPVILVIPYFILLLKKYRRLPGLKVFLPDTIPVTKVSLIIACRNEQENLPLLLDCISNQDFPWNLLEIIVVNDNSDDGTFKVASEYKSRWQITVLNNKGRGKKSALRTGIESATGNLIITTDADCRMGKKWISTIASFYEKYKPAMIISPVKLEAGLNFFGKLQELEFLSLQGVTTAYAISGNPIMCNGANLAFGRETYLNNAASLHDEIDSGDDVFLLHSLKKEKGSGIMWLESSDSMVTTAQSSSPGSFLKQRSRWISKWKYYSDRDTIVTALITFIAVLVQAASFISSFFDSAFIPVFLTIFILKSIPDYLIIRNTAIRYGNKNLIRWFIPSQLIYPFYVILVILRRNKSAIRSR
jgi:poly-beta-1,6-N-acetyl-D-glucosamine synthase